MLLFFLVVDEELEKEGLTLAMVWGGVMKCFFLSTLFQPWLYQKLRLKIPTFMPIEPHQTSYNRIILDPTA